jgi:hypothetical protein
MYKNKFFISCVCMSYGQHVETFKLVLPVIELVSQIEIIKFLVNRLP